MSGKEDHIHFVNGPVRKKDLKKIVGALYGSYSGLRLQSLVDNLKWVLLNSATSAGYSYSISDYAVSTLSVEKFIVDRLARGLRFGEVAHANGDVSLEERYRSGEEVWLSSRELRGRMLGQHLSEMSSLSPLSSLSISGARGTQVQFTQLVSGRGYMREGWMRPVFGSLREGLTPEETMLGAAGVRKGLIDTSLRTADAGYLTRRMVDVLQDVVISEEDCCVCKGVSLAHLLYHEGGKRSLKELVGGRVLAEGVKFPNGIFLAPNTYIGAYVLEILEVCDPRKVFVRTTWTCESSKGVCSRCYGVGFDGFSLVPTGTAVGVIAAQSMGEPGTQLTMQTFHSGGVSSSPKFYATNSSSSVASFARSNLTITRSNLTIQATGKASSYAKSPRKPLGLKRPTSTFTGEASRDAKTYPRKLVHEDIEIPGGRIISPVSGTMRVRVVQEGKPKRVRTVYGESGYLFRSGSKLVIENRGGRYRINIAKEAVFLVSEDSFSDTYPFCVQTVCEGQVIVRFPQAISLCEPADSPAQIGTYNPRGVFPIKAFCNGEVFFQGVTRTGSLRSRGKIWVLPGENISFPKTSRVTLKAGQYVRRGDKMASTPISNRHSGSVLRESNSGENNKVEIERTFLIGSFGHFCLDGFDWLLRSYARCVVSFPSLAAPGEELHSGTILGKASYELSCEVGRFFFCRGRGAEGDPSAYWLPEEAHYFISLEDVKVKEGEEVKKGDLIGKNRKGADGEATTFDATAGITGRVYFDRPRCIVFVKPGILYRRLCGRGLPSLDKGGRFVRKGDRLFSSHVVKEDVLYLDFSKVAGGYHVMLRPVATFWDLALSDEIRCGSLMHLNWDMSRSLRSGELISFSPLGCLQGFFRLHVYSSVRFESLKVLLKRTRAGKENKAAIKISVVEEVNLDRKNSLSRRTVSTGQRILPRTIVGFADTFSRVSGVIASVERSDVETVLKVIDDEAIVAFPFDFSEDKPLVKEGDLVTVGTHLTPSVVSDRCGQVLRVRGGILTIRRGYPHMLSPSDLLYVRNGALVRRGDVLSLTTFWYNSPAPYDSIFLKGLQESRDKPGRKPGKKKRKGKLVPQRETLKGSGGGDITDGVIAAADVLEVRRGHDPGPLAPVSGRVKVKRASLEIITPSGRKVMLDRPDGLIYSTGDFVAAGAILNHGSCDPNERIAKLFYFYTKWCGLLPDQACGFCFLDAQVRLQATIEGVFLEQGLNMALRHYEILVGKMTQRVRIVSSEGTHLSPGEVLLLNKARIVSKVARATDQTPPVYEPILTGLTSTGLKCEGFLSAASFQDTVRVLVEASVEGRRDWLNGMKENIIISRLLPLGYAYYQTRAKTHRTNKLVGTFSKDEIMHWILKSRVGSCD
jgi:hypothetical protein